MRKFTKAVSAFLSAVMLMSVVLSAPYAVSASSTTDDMEKIGVPLYQANVIANGYNNDGEGYYKLFKSLQDPLYYQLTDYMLEDDVLCWTSNFWNAAFNSEFQDNPSYFYEVMLMGFLKYDQNQINTSGVWNSKEMALSTSIYNTIASNYIDKFENPSYKDFVKQVNELSNDELKNILSNIEDIKITKQALEVLSKGCSYGAEFINAVVDYQALLDAKSERIELLKLAKAKVTDNEYFSKAVDDIIDKMEQTPIEYVSGQMLDKIWDDFLDSAWDLIIKGSPIATVLKAIDIEKMTLDVLFNTSETASDNFKLLVLYIVDTYFSSALEQAYDNYKSSGTVSNAATLIQCYRAYIEYQVYGLDYTKTFINNIVDGGTIHHIIEQIFFQESIESAAELTQHCDNQIRNRKNLLESLDKSADIYYSSTGLDELVDALESTDDNVNVPVTGISFKQSEITLNSTEDICLIYADVYPENASNKKVTYTSSDPSILSVPSDGGFATQNGEGTVTITATTEDGGFTATQKVNVNYKPVLATTDNGKCGDNVYWRLYSDGTLYISGIGKMYNYKYTSDFYDYRESIDNAIISDCVTSIGRSAFAGCRNLTSIRIPDSVTSIGRDAFSNCTSLENAYYTGSVSDWNKVFFGNYDSFPNKYADNFYILGDLDFSADDNIGKIKNYTFINCKSLTSITIPDSVTSIGDDAFENCTNLENITIPDSVTSIGRYAFYGCTSFTGITIPDSVTSIGDYAFYGCTSLENAYYTGSVLDWCKISFGKYDSYPNKYTDNFYILGDLDFSADDNIEEIKSYTFINCKSLTSITIPDSVTSIGGYAFKNCTSLESITIPNSVTSIGCDAFYNCTSFTGITIPDSVTSIGDYAFYGCTSLESITIPDNVTSIGECAFAYCTSLETVNYNAVNCNDMGDITGPVFEGCTILVTVNIGNNVQTIPRYAFYGCTSLESITIGNSVTSIGWWAFVDCKSLTSITLPDSITTIGEHAFYYCTSLESITIGNSVTSIGYDVFSYCTSLENVYYTGSVSDWSKISFGDFSHPNVYADNFYILGDLYFSADDNIDEIESNTFMNCKSLTSITIPNSVTSIGRYAFYGCTSLENITIPDNVTSIGDCAFAYCTSLETVNYNAVNCNDMGDFSVPVFEGCTALVTVNIGNNVQTIPSCAFYGCTSIESVTIGNNVTSIGWDAFENCKSLENITFPDSVTSIGDDAFENCTSLENITIPDSVTSIGDCAFAYCTSLETVNYNAVNCTAMGDNYDPVFEGCTSLVTVNIGNNVQTIPSYAFNNCTSLENVYYTGSVSDWSKISFGDYSYPNVYADNFYILGDLDFSADDNIGKIKNYTFRNCKSLTSITIPDSVTSIGDDAFESCTNLENITIPDSVTSIARNAFYGCTGLTDVYYDGSIEEWNEIFIDDDNDYLLDANIHYTYKFSQNVLGIQPNYDLSYGAKPFNLNAKAKTPLSYVSSNPKVAYVSSNGIVTIKGVGIATITITAKENNAYNSAKATVKINVRKAIQRVTGVKTRYVTSSGKSFSLNANAKTKLTYTSSNKNVAVVSSTGKVTVKAGGYAYITVMASENGNYKSAYVKTKIIAAPRNFTLKDISKVKKTGKTTAKITWKSLAGAKGYTVQLATNKSYKGAKTVKNSKNTATLTGLKKGKTYYVRIIAYTKVSGKNYSNKWYTLKFKM